jgi:hypothetical protein
VRTPKQQSPYHSRMLFRLGSHGLTQPFFWD